MVMMNSRIIMIHHKVIIEVKGIMVGNSAVIDANDGTDRARKRKRPRGKNHVEIYGDLTVI